MARDGRPLTKLAEIATILGLVVALIGLALVMRDQPGEQGPNSGDSPPPVSVPTAERSAPAAGGRPSTESGGADPVSPATEGPAAAEPGAEPRPTVVPHSQPLAPTPQGRPVATAIRPAQLPISAQAAFLLGRWRLSGESCADARSFRITDDVLEVLESNGNMIYSGRIQPIDNRSARVSGGSGGHFARNGRRLTYDPDSGRGQIFELCD